ncbi:MAG TPA: zinc ribbon domain-containing protein [Candidatus Acidoferrales bacterium]|nr:zinc ribbon domain-containing protein [Candidatus Acidoferrales bacterium]
MSFRKELCVIPRAAWIIAGFFYVGIATLAWFLVPTDHGMSQWPLEGQLAFIFLIPLFFFILIPLWGYVYGDAKRRGMRYVMWTLLAIFVTNFIGVILYFILRDPLPIECQSCHTAVLGKFTFCPNCGQALRPCCPQCGKSVERSWSNCAHCGTKLPGKA